MVQQIVGRRTHTAPHLQLYAVIQVRDPVHETVDLTHYVPEPLGLALPQILKGKLDGRAFALDIVSLGLSSAAVKGLRAGICGAVRLAGVGRAATLARLARTSKLLRVGGWLYTVAETAVILYAADDIKHGLEDYLDRRTISGKLETARGEFLRGLAADDGSPAARAVPVVRVPMRISRGGMGPPAAARTPQAPAEP